MQAVIPPELKIDVSVQPLVLSDATVSRADGAVVLVGEVRLLDAGARDVDEVVELAHREAGRLLDLSEVEAARVIQVSSAWTWLASWRERSSSPA